MGEIIVICLLAIAAGWWLWRLLRKEEQNENSDIAI